MCKATIKVVTDLSAGQRFKEKNVDFTLIDLSNINIDIKEKEDLGKDYLKFIGFLGIMNPSKFWWANSLSQKNELESRFYTRLVSLVYLNQIIQQKKIDKLIVVCGDTILLNSINDLLTSKPNIKASTLKINMFFLMTKSWLKYIIKLLLFFVKEIKKITVCRKHLGEKKGLYLKIKQAYVIKAWVDHRSFKNGKFADAYFTKLPGYLKKNNLNCVFFADINNDYRLAIQNIAKESDHIIIPKEYFFSVKELVHAIWASIKHRPIARGECMFRGINVKQIVKQELDEGFYNIQYLHHILYYYKTKTLAKNVEVKRFIYTFENYAWEKMSIIAFREVDDAIHCIGFQHAFISRDSFKYFTSKEEISILPKPDKIVSMGEITKRILEQYGNWPGDLLTTGCALRQIETMSKEPIEYGKKKDILVAFTMGADEAIRILNFLYNAGLQNYPHSIFLRFHPLTPLKIVFKRLSFKMPSNFIIVNGNSLNDDFQKVGIVLYTWTTVALEALMRGLPVIYLDANKPLTLDPLFDWICLKDEAHYPGELLHKIDLLLNLSPDDYLSSYAKSRAYLKKYFCPVTDESLSQFVT